MDNSAKPPRIDLMSLHLDGSMVVDIPTEVCLIVLFNTSNALTAVVPASCTVDMLAVVTKDVLASKLTGNAFNIAVEVFADSDANMCAAKITDLECTSILT